VRAPVDCQGGAGLAAVPTHFAGVVPLPGVHGLMLLKVPLGRCIVVASAALPLQRLKVVARLVLLQL